MTLADGGDLLAAIDITHPYPGTIRRSDRRTRYGQDYGVPAATGRAPERPRPGHLAEDGAGTDLPGLGPTWSLPALGPRTSSKWSINFGAGYDTASVWNAAADSASLPAQPGRRIGDRDGAFRLDLVLDSTYTPWVGNQAFADGVRFQHLASGFASDNIATRGVQADLNGRIWFTDPNDISGSNPGGIDASAVAGQSQPIYYPPAAGGFGLPPTAGCNVYAFGSGTFYERERSGQRTEAGAGGHGRLRPEPLLRSQRQGHGSTSRSIPTRSSGSRSTPSCVRRDAPEIKGECLALRRTIGDYGATLSPLSQMTGAPLLLIDPKGISRASASSSSTTRPSDATAPRTR